jgi:hypothetical protein
MDSLIRLQPQSLTKKPSALCGDAAYVEQLNRPRISLVFLAQHLHITFRFALALRSLIYFER